MTVKTLNKNKPAPKTCADCKFARHLENNRYVCTEKCGLESVVLGQWEPSINCPVTPEVREVEVEVAEVEEAAATFKKESDAFVEKVRKQAKGWGFNYAKVVDCDAFVGTKLAVYHNQGFWCIRQYRDGKITVSNKGGYSERAVNSVSSAYIEILRRVDRENVWADRDRWSELGLN